MSTRAPMRVVLAAVGSRGDVQPMLALAQLLRARGHAPLLAVPPNFEGWVRGLGFDYAPLGMDIQQFLQDNPVVLGGSVTQGLQAVKGYFAAQLPLQARQLSAACDGADVIVSAGLAIMAASVAQHLRLPHIGIAYTTCLLPSGMHPPPKLPWQGLPHWVNRLLWWVQKQIGKRVVEVPANGARATMGLPPMDLHHHLMHEMNAVLAVDEPLFPPDLAWHYPYASYIYFDDPAPLDAALDTWLAEGEPPVYVGFGSMSGEGTERIGRMIVEAVSATGRRCLVGAGWAGMGTGELPAGWRVVGEAPHAQLFPRMAAVIHHGGSGTTASALRAGVPQVILPLILDQYHHAHRLYLAGIVPKPVPMERVTAQQLSQAIEATLALPDGPRKAAAARLQASDGRGDIVRMVEALQPLQ